MNATYIGAIIGAILIALGLYFILTSSPVCDTSLRIDENGIVLSDPCGNLQ